MADNTGIVWCDSTFNPWIGCTKVGPGCDNCYAEADFDLRRHRAKWGAGNPRSRTSVANWKKPLQWNKDGFYECPDCGLRGTAKEMGDDPKQCNHLRAAPARRRVFCASLADVFDNEVPVKWRDDLWTLIGLTQNIDWLILTKRIGNASRMLPWMPDYSGPDGQRTRNTWRNVWLGATVVNQEEADRDIPKLLATPARVRWLSMEPLLGQVDLDRWLHKPWCPTHDFPGGFCIQDCGDWRRIDWVVVGGESGSKARPMHPNWARSLRDQCAAAGVPFLFKQWGEWAPYDRSRQDGESLATAHSLDLPMARVGKKLAGRLLDGVQHNAFPAPPAPVAPERATYPIPAFLRRLP